MKSFSIRFLCMLAFASSPVLFPVLKPMLPVYRAVATAYELFFLAPLFLFGLVAFLALRLNQTRIVYSAVLYLFLFISLHNFAYRLLEPVNFDYFQKILLVLSILNFLLIFVLDEDSIIGPLGLLRALSIFLTVAITMLLAKSDYIILQTLFTKQWVIPAGLMELPDIIWPVFITSSVVLLIYRDKAVYPYKISLVLSFITLIIAFNKNIIVQNFTIDLKIYNAFAFTIIGLMSLYAVYKLYWQNVYIDELTQIPNRRAFNEQLKKLGRKYSIAMLDIDHFKKFNDIYGHTEGDNVLRYVAKHLKQSNTVKVFRYGGEEFSIIYPGRRAGEVRWHLEQLREGLATCQFYIRMNETNRKSKSEKDRGKITQNGKKVQVTLSIGVANRNERLKTAEDVINAADKALYSAKKKGRNQCVISKG